MKLALYKYFLSLFAPDTESDHEDREDEKYIQMAKEEDGPLEPLRDVLAEIKSKRRGDIHRPITPAS